MHGGHAICPYGYEYPKQSFRYLALLSCIATPTKKVYFVCAGRSIILIVLARRHSLVPACQLVVNDILDDLVNALVIKAPAKCTDRCSRALPRAFTFLQEVLLISRPSNDSGLHEYEAVFQACQSRWGGICYTF